MCAEFSETECKILARKLTVMNFNDQKFIFIHVMLEHCIRPVGNEIDDSPAEVHCCIIVCNSYCHMLPSELDTFPRLSFKFHVLTSTLSCIALVCFLPVYVNGCLTASACVNHYR